MKDATWGVLVVMLGVTSIFFIVMFQSITNTDEHNSELLQEITEAAMWDAFDDASYKNSGSIRIDREKFVENFVRRYAESASSFRTYNIKIYDVNEQPPKVSLKVTSFASGSISGETTENVTLSSSIDAIIEEPY